MWLSLINHVNVADLAHAGATISAAGAVVAAYTGIRQVLKLAGWWPC